VWSTSTTKEQGEEERERERERERRKMDSSKKTKAKVRSKSQIKKQSVELAAVNSATNLTGHLKRQEKVLLELLDVDLRRQVYFLSKR